MCLSQSMNAVAVKANTAAIAASKQTVLVGRRMAIIGSKNPVEGFLFQDHHLLPRNVHENYCESCCNRRFIDRVSFDLCATPENELCNESQAEQSEG